MEPQIKSFMLSWHCIELLLNNIEVLSLIPFIFCVYVCVRAHASVCAFVCACTCMLRRAFGFGDTLQVSILLLYPWIKPRFRFGSKHLYALRHFTECLLDGVSLLSFLTDSCTSLVYLSCIIILLLYCWNIKICPPCFKAQTLCPLPDQSIGRAFNNDFISNIQFDFSSVLLSLY